MSTQISLETVKQNFADWRATRGTNRKIPGNLWDQALELRDHYKISKILSTLGISTAQYKAKIQIQNEREISINALAATTSFVDINLPGLSVKNVNSIELIRPDGIKLHLRDSDSQSLTTLLQAFLGK